MTLVTLWPSSQDESGNSITVAEYFRNKYPKFSIRDDLPAACVGRAKDPSRIRIPLDVLDIKAGQQVKPITSDLLGEMVKHSAAKPQERFETIAKTAKSVRDDENNEAFGIKMDDMVKTMGRQLASPDLEYKDGFVVKPMQIKGEWNLRGGPGGRDIGFIKSGSCNGFVVVNFDPRARLNQLVEFMNKFLRMADERGIRLGRDLSGGRPIDGTAAAQRGEVDAFLGDVMKRDEMKRKRDQRVVPPSSG